MALLYGPFNVRHGLVKHAARDLCIHIPVEPPAFVELVRDGIQESCRAGLLHAQHALYSCGVTIVPLGAERLTSMMTSSGSAEAADSATGLLRVCTTYGLRIYRR